MDFGTVVSGIRSKERHSSDSIFTPLCVSVELTIKKVKCLQLFQILLVLQFTIDFLFL